MTRQEVIRLLSMCQVALDELDEHNIGRARVQMLALTRQLSGYLRALERRSA